MFYFEQLLRTALNGVNGTAVMPAIVQIASAILVATLLFNVYEAFVRGGDVRTLGIGAIKYLILGLILLNYGQIFLGVNTMFNQVADFIATVGPGGGDVFTRWLSDAKVFVNSSPSLKQSLFALVIGTPTALLSAILIVIGLVLYAVAYALFCLFYAFYGTVLYVCGPLVLALYPALSTTGLARSYLTNLIIFHAWGLIYAILGCLIAAVNIGTVGQMLAAGDAAGFFAGAGDALLLALASILFALCIALIPMIARRIVQGDVGSTMFAVTSAAMTVATLGATAAMNGVGYAISHGGSGGGTGGGNSAPGGGGKGGQGGRNSNGAGAADMSSQQAPKPPEDKATAGSPGGDGSGTRNANGGANDTAMASRSADATTAAKESTGSAQNSSADGNVDGGSRSPRGHQNTSQRAPAPFNARVYTPMSLAAIASAEAGILLGTAYRKTASALRSNNAGGEKNKE